MRGVKFTSPSSEDWSGARRAAQRGLVKLFRERGSKGFIHYWKIICYTKISEAYYRICSEELQSSVAFATTDNAVCCLILESLVRDLYRRYPILLGLHNTLARPSDRTNLYQGLQHHCRILTSSVDAAPTKGRGDETRHKDARSQGNRANARQSRKRKMLENQTAWSRPFPCRILLRLTGSLHLWKLNPYTFESA